MGFLAAPAEADLSAGFVPAAMDFLAAEAGLSAGFAAAGFDFASFLSDGVLLSRWARPCFQVGE